MKTHNVRSMVKCNKTRWMNARASNDFVLKSYSCENNIDVGSRIRVQMEIATESFRSVARLFISLMILFYTLAHPFQFDWKTFLYWINGKIIGK